MLVSLTSDCGWCQHHRKFGVSAPSSVVRLRLRRGDKRRRGDVVAAARRVLKRFAADEHTYVEVKEAASPKSVITQSRAVSAFSGPFTGISCRPCKN